MKLKTIIKQVLIENEDLDTPVAEALRRLLQDELEHIDKDYYAEAVARINSASSWVYCRALYWYRTNPLLRREIEEAFEVVRLSGAFILTDPGSLLEVIDQSEYKVEHVLLLVQMVDRYELHVYNVGYDFVDKLHPHQLREFMRQYSAARILGVTGGCYETLVRSSETVDNR